MQYKIFGCKVNKYYINKRIAYFQSKEESNDFLLATCEVTDRAKAKRLKEVRQNAENGQQIYITGCGVLQQGKLMEEEIFYQIYPELLEYKGQITLLGEKPDLETKQKNIFTRDFVVIQNGCDNHCTFCLTVQKRGSHSSRPLDEIIDDIRDIQSQGGKEIIITGINLAAWGANNTKHPQESKFAELLEAIIDQTTIPRIRISSIGPEYINDKTLKILSNPRFMPHFHISIQHFADQVLQSMNRNYNDKTLDYVLNGLGNLDRPDREYISIGADIIVGFPGETEIHFQQILDAVKKYNITKVHAFPFSDHHKGEHVTASSLANQISQEDKIDRQKRSIQVADEVRNDFLKKNIGQKWQIIIEGSKDDKSHGWTDNYIQVTLDKKYKRGEMIDIIL